MQNGLKQKGKVLSVELESVVGQASEAVCSEAPWYPNDLYSEPVSTAIFVIASAQLWRDFTLGCNLLLVAIWSI